MIIAKLMSTFNKYLNISGPFYSNRIYQSNKTDKCFYVACTEGKDRENKQINK